MKHLIILAFMISSAICGAQGNFEKGMQKAFELWENDKWGEAENLFERIAKAEPDQWLPHYYIAQMNSLKSWNEKDETVLKSQLDKAQQHLDLAKNISENNPEIMVLQAHLYTNWVAFDGATYGMKYGQTVTEIYNKAYELAPDNPRVVYNKAEWGMGSARYFGQDTKPFCKDIEKSIELFANFKPESELHPNWGQKRAEQVLASCN
ncbi:hypothetical protein [Winogradskyella sp. 3972H.M.0a.05]|uniref:hypothetical protein n=1 Tax=Winogradskyella sp. 3972H.M.0a.05 TaxID=2950277 RepID=UPI0033914B5C